MKVADMVGIMADIAPPHLAEKWDNSGLQFGSLQWDADNVFVALDPGPEVVDAACRAGADMLITHHPLIFKPLSLIDVDSSIGKIINSASANRLAIFSAHTNLDSARGGVNDVLCDRLGFGQAGVLCPSEPTQDYKMVVFVPEDHLQQMVDAVCQSQAGKIGNYSCCTFSSPGHGTFMPGFGSKPYEGKHGQLSRVPEVRMETIVKKQDLNEVVRQLKASHPYETMAYDVYPLAPEKSDQGLGRIATLAEPRTLADLAKEIKHNMDLAWTRFSGPPDLLVNRAAVCSGSGGGLLEPFLASRAEVLISGDIKYHEAVTAAQHGRGIIDIGHFASEHIVVDVLCSRIMQAAEALGSSIKVTAFDGETDPFTHV
jgi:dinuclear metal center YbgI/SA1388 family protein